MLDSQDDSRLVISALLLEVSHLLYSRSAFTLTTSHWWLVVMLGPTGADALFMSKGFIKSPSGTDLLSFFQISSYFCYPVFEVI